MAQLETIVNNPVLVGTIQNVHGVTFAFYQQTVEGVMRFALVDPAKPAPVQCAYADIGWLFRMKCISKY